MADVVLARPDPALTELIGAADTALVSARPTGWNKACIEAEPGPVDSAG